MDNTTNPTVPPFLSEPPPLVITLRAGERDFRLSWAPGSAPTDGVLQPEPTFEESRILNKLLVGEMAIRDIRIHQLQLQIQYILELKKKKNAELEAKIAELLERE